MNSDWLDIELLEDYLDGKLDANVMHKIEKQALEDPFVAQALAGLGESPRRSKESISLLQKQLYERIALQQASKKDSVFTWQRLSVAAAAAVMFISVSILFFMRDKQNREQMTKSRAKKVEVNLAPSPSVLDSAKTDNYASVIPAKSINPVSATPENPGVKTQNKAVIGRTVRSYGLQKAITSTVDSAVTTAAVATSKVMSDANEKVAVVAPAVSSPVGGWAAFDDYLNENNKLGRNNSGKFVELSFMIDNEGRPSAILIIKSADKEFDDEAIRLIKEGPKWEPPKSSESRIIYTVTF